MINNNKPKSFLQSFLWVTIMLLSMGAVFLGIAAIMQFVSISPHNINVTINGIRQPPTEETVRTFRFMFLLIFGIIGLILAITGGIIAGRAGMRRRRAHRLKEEGVRIIANVVQHTASAIYVNHRNLTRLHCAHTASDGRIYIFKSGLLRMDPVPYLYQGQVNVYYDRDNINNYYVDIDGSVGVGNRVIEL